MIWFAIGALAAVRLRLFTVQRFAFIAPMALLIWYAVSRSTISALAAWLAAGITLAILWKSDRG